jgi:hypothetical protein
VLEKCGLVLVTPAEAAGDEVEYALTREQWAAQN